MAKQERKGEDYYYNRKRKCIIILILLLITKNNYTPLGAISCTEKINSKLYYINDLRNHNLNN